MPQSTELPSGDLYEFVGNFRLNGDGPPTTGRMTSQRLQEVLLGSTSLVGVRVALMETRIGVVEAALGAGGSGAGLAADINDAIAKAAQIPALSERIDRKADQSALDEIALAAEQAGVLLAPYKDLVVSASDRPGDGRSLFTREMSGDPRSRPPIDRGMVADGGKLGQVLRISGADIDPDTGFIEVAPRRHYYIQDYRTYQIQHEFARHRDPLDPQNHAVELRIQLLRSDLSAIRTLRLGSPYAPTKAQGPQSINTFIGKRGASGTISFVVTDEAAYAVPYFRIYGNGAETDLGSVRLLDVTFALDGGVDNTLILDRLRKLEADQASGFSTGFVSRPTWSSGGDEETALALTTPVPFTIGEVPDDDKGFHDGIVSEAGYSNDTGKVPNAGRYAPVGTPPVWRRTGDTTSKAAAAALLANAVVKTTVNDAEFVLIPSSDKKSTSLISFSNFLLQVGDAVGEKYISHKADTAVGIAPAVLIPADPNRNSIQIINTSVENGLLIGFGAPPEKGSRHTLALPPSGGYEREHCRPDVIYVAAEAGSVSVFAEYTNSSGVDVVSGGLVDAYLARSNAVAPAGNRAALVDLFADLRASGAYRKFRAAAILANFHTTIAAQDLVRNVAWSRFNSPEFVVNRGFKGNGVDAYLNTNYAPRKDVGHYDLNSHSFGCYVDSVLQGPASYMMGAVHAALGPNRTSVQAVARSSTTDNDLIAVPGRGGLFGVSRSSAAGYRFAQGETVKDQLTPSSTLGSTDYEMLLLAGGTTANAEGAAGFATNTPHFAWVGEAMTDAEMLSIGTAMAKYMAALDALGA